MRQHLVRPTAPPARTYTKREVANLAAAVRDELHGAGRCVNAPDVINIIRTRLNVARYEDLCVGRPYEIPALKELFELENKVFCFIQTFMNQRPIVTLWEIEQEVCAAEAVPNYAALRLGPLIKHPLVIRGFSPPPSLTAAPAITSADVALALRTYLNSRKWGEKVDTPEFVRWLAIKRQVADPLELCIKVHGVGLYIKTMGDVDRALRSKIAAFNKDLTSQANKEEAQEKARAVEAVQQARDARRRQLEADVHRHIAVAQAQPVEEEDVLAFVRTWMTASNDPAASRASVAEQMQKALSLLLQHQSSANSKKRASSSSGSGSLAVLCKIAVSYLRGYRASLSARKLPPGQLFDAALQSTSQSAPSSVSSGAGATAGSDHGGRALETAAAGPSADEVLEEVERRAGGDPSALGLATLASLEQAICVHFHARTFECLGLGSSFLAFLAAHPERFGPARASAPEADDWCASGGAGGGTAATGAVGGPYAHPISEETLLEVAAQCMRSCGVALGAGQLPEAALAAVERALCVHFGVQSVTQLRFGSVQRIAARVAEREAPAAGPAALAYEAALVCSVRHPAGLAQPPAEEASTREAARALLAAAPALQRLEEVLPWEAAFSRAPDVGPLPSFLSRPAPAEHEATPLPVLVCADGSAVRLPEPADPDLFLAAAGAGNAEAAAAQAAAVVAACGGVDHAPMQLLARHCETALRELQGHGADGASRAASFASNFLFALPPLLRRAMAQDLVFGPASAALEGDPFPALLAASRGPQQRAALIDVGLHLGLPSAVAHFRHEVASARAAGHAHEVPARQQEPRQRGARGGLTTLAERASSSPPAASRSLLFDAMAADPSPTLLPPRPGGEPDSELELQAAVDRDLGLAPGSLEAASQAREAEEAVCRAIVESIRRDEFAIGVQLDEEGRRAMGVQQERLGRALARLSSELYSTDTHFVLELVQNADDNRYGEEVLPSLAFVLDGSRVDVYNNETGFTERNVRALCDVGRSTKEKQTGYIGAKGIGFKSVFRVTSAPEIHSNGFHIKFDLDSAGPLGFILPHWVEADGALQHQRDPFAQLSAAAAGWPPAHEWRTRISLPLRRRAGDDEQLVSVKFEDVHDSLLLFLNKLRRIAIVDREGDRQRFMERRDLGNGIVEILNESGKLRYLVIREAIAARSDRRPGVDSTEVALAFPLFSGAAEDESEPLPPQQVFAYLPVRSYGFKFIIQADFLVPSSRQDVDADSPWNQIIRDAVPGLFMRAIAAFRELGGSASPAEVASFYLRFVPLEGQVTGFFQSSATLILRSLRSTKCMLAESGEWVLPNQVVFARPGSSAHDLVPPDMLQRYLGLHYLHRDIAISEPLRRSLGIPLFSAAHLIELALAMVRDAEGRSGLTLPFIGGFLACLFHCVQDGAMTAEELARARALPILPVAGPGGDESQRRLVALSDAKVFFPLAAAQAAGALASFQGEIPFLHPDLLPSIPSEVGRTMCRAMLERLGVAQITAHDAAELVVLPACAPPKEAPASTQADAERWARYLAFMREHIPNCKTCNFQARDRSQAATLFDRLRAGAVVATSQGPVRLRDVPAARRVHFSVKLGNHTNLPEYFSGAGFEWIVLGETPYLQRAAGKAGGALTWRELFERLGVTDFLSPERASVTVANKEESAWRSVAWPARADGEGGEGAPYLVEQDWRCEELEALVHSILQKHRLPDADAAAGRPEAHGRQLVSSKGWHLMKELVRKIDLRWKSDFEHATSARVRVASRGADDSSSSSFATDSSFVLFLRGLAWVPSWTEGRLYLPGLLWRDVKQVKALLGARVEYAGAELQSREFARALGMRDRVEHAEMLAILKSWSRSAASSGGTFSASTAQFIEVYRFLLDPAFEGRAGVVEALRGGALLFVPLYLERNDPHAPVEGRFYRVEEVAWYDPSRVMDQHLRCLVRYYKPLDGFLNDVIATVPSFEQYLAALAGIAETKSTDEAGNQVRAVFAMWAASIAEGRVDVPQVLMYWRPALLKAAIFPTQRKAWVTLAEEPIVADDAEIAGHFAAVPGVHFLDVQTRAAERQERDPLPFLATIGVPLLSSIVSRQVVTYGTYFNTKIEETVRQLMPFAQRFVRHVFPDDYARLQAAGVAQRVAALRVSVTNDVFVQFALPGGRAAERQHVKCALDGTWLYVKLESADEYGPIFKELSRLFFGGAASAQLAEFLYSLALTPEPAREAFVADGRRLPPLPEADPRWELPRAVAAGVAAGAPVDADVAEVERRAAQKRREADEEAASSEEEAEGKGARAPARQRTSQAWPPQSTTAPAVAVAPPPSRDEKAKRQWPPPPPEALGRHLQPVDEEQERAAKAAAATAAAAAAAGAPRASSDGAPHNTALLEGSGLLAGSGSGRKGLGGSESTPQEAADRPRSAREEGSSDGAPRSPRGDAPPRGAWGGDEPRGPLEGDGAGDGSGGGPQTWRREAGAGEAAPWEWVAERDPSVAVVSTEEIAGRLREALPSIPAEVGEGLSEEGRLAIGRWGEELVFRFLRASVPAGHAVEWLNAARETGASFDLRLRSPEGHETLVEVKSTAALGKELFPISPAEMRLAEEARARFWIVRVYGAGSAERVRLVRVEDPARLWRQGTIRLCLFL
eukprot:tig00001416_g8956.t1